jgi:hypothetical protein
LSGWSAGFDDIAIFSDRTAMTTIETYRANAAAQRAAAENTNLPNRREMHQRSAITWETMARAAEETQGRAQVNMAAKASAAA